MLCSLGSVGPRRSILFGLEPASYIAGDRPNHTSSPAPPRPAPPRARLRQAAVVQTLYRVGRLQRALWAPRRNLLQNATGGAGFSHHSNGRAGPYSRTRTLPPHPRPRAAPPRAPVRLGDRQNIISAQARREERATVLQHNSRQVDWIRSTTRNNKPGRMEVNL